MLKRIKCSFVFTPYTDTHPSTSMNFKLRPLGALEGRDFRGCIFSWGEFTQEEYEKLKETSLQRRQVQWFNRSFAINRHTYRHPVTFYNDYLKSNSNDINDCNDDGEDSKNESKTRTLKFYRYELKRQEKEACYSDYQNIVLS